MARFLCNACSQEGELAYDPELHECPRCGSPDVVFAIPTDKLPDEIVEALLSAEPLDDEKNED